MEIIVCVGVKVFCLSQNVCVFYCNVRIITNEYLSGLQKKLYIWSLIFSR
jgi:hypothetical protein